jgi:hypothetical protein
MDVSMTNCIHVSSEFGFAVHLRCTAVIVVLRSSKARNGCSVVSPTLTRAAITLRGDRATL